MEDQPLRQQSPTQPPVQPISAAPVVGVPPKQEEKKSSGVMNELFEFIWETAKVVLLSLIIILPVRYYLIQPFFVKGSSMVPNFHDKEYVLVDKWTYRLGAPERGDVIVFRYPDNPKEYFIKRIIGLPGETVVAGNNNSVVVYNARYPDGFTVFEKGYLPETNPTYCGSNTTYCGTRVTLADQEYYVMGDNREHSSDSRFFGPVNISYFAGMAWLRLWPLDKISFIPRTQYPPIVQ